MRRLDRHNLGPIAQENMFALGAGMDQVRSGCFRSLQVHVWAEPESDLFIKWVQM